MVARNEGNLIFLTLYIIGVTYTFTKMIESIDDKIKFTFDKQVVDEQLKDKDLQNDIGISFRLSPSYFIDELKELSVSIENKSQNLALYVDWDNCSLVVEYNKQSRRVIRKSPDVTRDLGVPQSPSLIAPSKTLSAAVTAEDVFKLDELTKTYQVNTPLINISALEKSPVKAQRLLFQDFIDGKKELKFSLQLVLRISELRVGLAPGENKPPMCIIDCPFTIKKLPWYYAMPWNRKR
ncbi:hypothetical protein NIES592_17385 [Fischerella major NIES-592]|uniref:Uncharacterized protein n=2 Tax=Fischerella TaxID=1190 RepID=A0A1U7GWJ5_9CYAN|nr:MULTISPECIES: hypothetical protein [Fischerella]OKH12616.1 hypothetical protein NIES592_17385 [Fischerella major NIES-592]PMB44463.1 hypothetical protein CEN41_10460 [Fischerella thermalis CCMEE 5330]